MTKTRTRPAEAAMAQEIETLRSALAIMKARVAELEQLADTDTLTPLPNRRAFERELAEALARVGKHAETAAVLFIDLNGLKSINDTHGHQAGDAVILHVARELRSHVRISDTVARIGGDEFAIILHRVKKANAEAKAKALAQHLSETLVDIGRTLLPVGIGYGVAMIRKTDKVETVLARADDAMYALRRAQRSDR
jgi:diguanylate cyclase (GGDEF)-like protein